jgi:hypothetical protein
MIKMEIQNRGGFLKLAADAQALDNDIKDVIRAMAREYNAIVRAELSRPKSGILYGNRNLSRVRTVRKRVELFGGKKRTVTRRVSAKVAVRSWRASRPGEAPAVFSGNLLRGLRVAVPSREKGYGAKVFSRKSMAAHRHLLEFGTAERIQPTKGGKTRRVGRVLPRPLWTPLQARAMADLERRLLRVIDANAAFRGG